MPTVLLKTYGRVYRRLAVGSIYYYVLKLDPHICTGVDVPKIMDNWVKKVCVRLMARFHRLNPAWRHIDGFPRSHCH